MDSNYIITSDGAFISESDLYHHGVRGMKWGVRRYQNKDGSLTTAGRKRYSDGDSDGKSGTGRDGRDGKSTSKGTGPKGSAKPTPAKKVDQDAKDKAKAKADEAETKKQDADPNAKAKGKKTTITTDKVSELSDKELQDRLNRIDNEKKYNDKMAELGYVQVNKYSDLDAKITELRKQKEFMTLQNDLAKQPQISDLQRQKEYMQLQKDIKNLDKELNPKKESVVAKYMKKVVDDVVIPAATNAGKKALENWLTERGAEILKKEADKTADKIADKERKVREALDKENAKAAAKNAKRSAAEYEKTGQSTTYNSRGGERSRVNPNESLGLSVRSGSTTGGKRSGIGIKGIKWGKRNSSNTNKVYEGEFVGYVNRPSTSLTTTRNTSSGKSYVSGYLNSPIASLPSPNISGYLPVPKDDD